MACETFRLITWAPGDESMARDLLREVRDGKRDIEDPRVMEETATQLREVLGDTSGTVLEIKPHNAAYRAICTQAIEIK